MKNSDFNNTLIVTLMNLSALSPEHPDNNYEDNFQLTLKRVEEQDKLKPLPIYKGPFALCRSVAFSTTPYCSYCNLVETHYTPLPNSDLWICCLGCYEKFRVSYLSYLEQTKREDSAEERNKYVKVFKKLKFKL